MFMIFLRNPHTVFTVFSHNVLIRRSSLRFHSIFTEFSHSFHIFGKIHARITDSVRKLTWNSHNFHTFSQRFSHHVIERIFEVSTKHVLSREFKKSSRYFPEHNSLHVVAPAFLALCWCSDVDLNDRLLMLYRWVWLPSYIGAQGHYAYTWHQYLSSWSASSGEWSMVL